MKESIQYYPVQTYKFKELCNMYGVSANTFRKELNKIPGMLITRQIKKGKKNITIKMRKDTYYPKDVEIIFNHLNPPIKNDFT